MIHYSNTLEYMYIYIFYICICLSIKNKLFLMLYTIIVVSFECSYSGVNNIILFNIKVL